MNTTSSNLTPEQSSALAAGITIFYIITFVVAYVLTGLLLGRIFKKAGIPSWIAWVPFYNTWKMLEIGGQPGFWAVLSIIPFVNIASVIFLVIAEYNIGLKLGKSSTFVLLAIFLPIVWLIWLAVDKSVWNDKLGVPSKAAKNLGVTPTA